MQPHPIALDLASTSEKRDSRRRATRLRRVSLLDANLNALDTPAITIAQDVDDFLQAFHLVHNVYLSSRYLPRAKPEGLQCGLHHLLPETCVFLFRSSRTVVSTMTLFPDTPQFGLPMDAIYRKEVDVLRAQGRRVAEVGSLATAVHCRGNNIIMHLAKAIFQYATATRIDDICIMVNPKHVRFYTSLFLFSPFGEKRHYPRVNAPAVALRVDMRTIAPALRKAYDQSDSEANLYAFLTGIGDETVWPVPLIRPSLGQRHLLPSRICRQLIPRMPASLQRALANRSEALRQCYRDSGDDEAAFPMPLMP